MAHIMPLVEGGGTFIRNADAVQNGGILLFAAGNKSRFLTGDILTADDEGEHLVDDVFDLTRHGVPVEGHGEDDTVGGEEVVRNGVEAIIKGAGPSGGVAGLAAVAAAHVHEGGVMDNDGVALGLGGGHKGMGHGGAVAVFPGRTQKDDDFFRHGIDSSFFA